LDNAQSAVEAQHLLSNDSVLESYGHLSKDTYLWLQECWEMNYRV